MRRLKQIGAKVNDSCGIHVHVDAANHNRQSLKNLISIMYSKEDLLFKALQVNEVRAIRFVKGTRTYVAEGQGPICRGDTRSDSVGADLV